MKIFIGLLFASITSLFIGNVLQIDRKSKIVEKWEVNDNDKPFLLNEANKSFGNVTNWIESRTRIVDGALRIQIPKNSLSSGIVSNIKIDEGSEFELKYQIKFDKDFDWGLGGKVGFGFGIGNVNAGGNPPWDGKGGTFRLCWHRNKEGRIVFIPYLYYKDQKGVYGDVFSSYPEKGSLEKDRWYSIRMKIKSNTAENKNGRAILYIDKEKVLDMPIRWTTDDSKRLINTMTFHTFRGGAEEKWKSSRDGYVYYDNLILKRIRK